jgi:hypothetical protein
LRPLEAVAPDVIFYEFEITTKATIYRKHIHPKPAVADSRFAHEEGSSEEILRVVLPIVVAEQAGKLGQLERKALYPQYLGLEG